MKLRNRDVGDRPDTSLVKKRKLEDQQDSGPSKPPPKKPKKPSGPKKKPPPKKKPAEPSKERESDPVNQQILELLQDVSSPESNTPLEARRRRPIPPGFEAAVNKYLKEGRLDQATAQYYLDIRRKDSFRVPAEDGSGILQDAWLEFALQEEEGEDATGGEDPGRWKPGQWIGEGGNANVTVWEKARDNGQKFKIVVKYAKYSSDFWKDYNYEGNLIRRLNDVGCQNVIKVLDWFPVLGRYRTCFEYGEFGDVKELFYWYKSRKLIFPEAFVWHIFHSMANALCYCRYGTNRVHSLHSRTHGSDWDQIIHADMKLDNYVLTRPDEDCNPLYPCVKLIDFSLAYPLGEPRLGIQKFENSWPRDYPVAGNIAPETVKSIPVSHVARPGEYQDSYSDVYGLGVSMARILQCANRYMAKPIRTLMKRDRQTVNPTKRRNFSAYYSPQLKELVRRCRSQNPLERPPIYSLYLETKSGMEAFRDYGYQAEQESPPTVIDGVPIHHNRVLYTFDHMWTYNHNIEVEEAYIKANLAPLLEAEGPELSGKEEIEGRYTKLRGTTDYLVTTPELAYSDHTSEAHAKHETETPDYAGSLPSRSPRPDYGEGEDDEVSSLS